MVKILYELLWIACSEHQKMRNVLNVEEAKTIIVCSEDVDQEKIAAFEKRFNSITGRS